MPSFILETERLLLRPPERCDADALVRHMEWDVVKNLSRPPFPYLEEHALAFLASQEQGRAKGSDYAFAITDKRRGAFLGMCGVHLRGKGFELGYWLARPHWGMGYATEAAGEVLGFAFRNLRAEEVEAGWYHDNPASGRVLEKLGFRPNGADQRDCAARGHAVLCNLVLMSRAEYVQRQAA
ncbi:MAG TPA: GNAT family N-acetyltransferase [Rhizomicrobium sp.]|nr:GNAT family N-acetyltransferase [Rhizomicrobium sp.]